MSFLSKVLYPVASGWTTCLRTVVATTILVKEVDNLTLDQNLILTSLSAVEEHQNIGCLIHITRLNLETLSSLVGETHCNQTCYTFAR